MLKHLLQSHSYILYWKLSFWVVLSTLLFLTLMPSPPTPIEFNQIDKVYHLVAFAGFTFVFCLAFRRLNRLAIFTFSALLGITIEVIQFYMPSRGFSFGDMVADIIGVLIGLFVAKILLKDKR